MIDVYDGDSLILLGVARIPLVVSVLHTINYLILPNCSCEYNYNTDSPTR